MTLARSPFGMKLRLLLAAVLLLAGLAGARLQGHLAGGNALAATLGALCSGQPNPDGSGDPGQHAAHEHCILCHMPVATSVATPGITAQLTRRFQYGPETAARPAAFALHRFYQPRAPPALSA